MYAYLIRKVNMPFYCKLAVCDAYVLFEAFHMVCLACFVWWGCIWVCMLVFQARCFANASPECSTSQHSLHSFQIHGTWLVYFVSSLFTSKVSSSGALVAWFLFCTTWGLSLSKTHDIFTLVVFFLYGPQLKCMKCLSV